MKSFAEIFSAGIELHGSSLNQIAIRLGSAGYPINKSTLTRWRSGESFPSLNKLDVLRHLGRALSLTPEENRQFLAEISQALGFNIPEAQAPAPAGQTFQYRRHLGYEVAAPFAGRQKEFAELLAQLRQKKSIAITGMGGVGKTRLAQALVQAVVGEFAHGCEYLEVSADQTSVQIIRNIARLLGIHLSPSLSKTGSARTLLNLIRQQTVGINLVFLVDNVDQAEQVRDLVNSLVEITWVFTARRVSLKRTGVYHLQLQPPEPDDAVQIFLKYIRQPASRAWAGNSEIARIGAIVERLGRLPLALRLAANLLDNGIFETPAALQNWLEHTGFLKTRSFSANLRQLFDFMLERIPPAARLLFDLCGLFARPRIQISRLRSLAQKTNFKIGAPAWDLLGDLSLVNYASENVLELHPLLHEYARLRIRQSPDFPRLWQEFTNLYVQTAAEISALPNEADRNYWALLPDEADLLAVLDAAHQSGAWSTLEALFPALTGYLWSTGNFAAYEDVEIKCLQAARSAGSPAWEAKILAELGFLKFDQRQWETAESMFLQAQDIHDRTPEAYLDRARVRRYRALLATAQNQLTLAVGLLDEAAALLTRPEIQADPRLPTARMWLHTARMRVLYRSESFARAEKEGLAAQEIYAALHKEGGYRLAGFQILLGDVFAAQRKPAEAEQAWKSILPASSSDPHAPEHADAHTRLGWLSAVSEDIESAVRRLDTARALYTRFGMLEQIQRVDALLSAVRAERSLPEFMEFFEE